MLALLSPSKTQDFSSANTIAHPTLPDLLCESEHLVRELLPLSPAEIGELMHISPKLSDLNYTRFHAFNTPFDANNAKPAVLAFKGDVYDGLDAESLSQKQLDVAQHRLRMLSGLYGILRPFDLIQPYRLEMKTPLANPRGKDLYAFWEDRITHTLNKHLQQEKTDIVVNLASNEYFKAINTNKLRGTLVTAQFKERKNGSLKVVALFAKRARGMMARYIVENNIRNVQDLREFNMAGYVFEPSHSSKTEFVFAREGATR
jgi:cytoplasmic iron level regulating protein YaaA (DUF328/UPF0246 family)